MKHTHTPLRPGMTAIAAVLALSSTQLLAQSADTPASTAAPVLVTPPAVQSTAPVVTPQEAPQAAAPATTMQTVSTPIVHTPDTATTSAQDEPAPARAVTHTKTTKIHTASAAATSAAPRAADPAPVAPVPPPVTVAKTTVVKTAPNGGLEATTTTTSKSAITPAVAPQSAQTVSDEGMIAGIAGLGLIALAGGAFAYTRRTRRYEDVEVVPEAKPEPELETAAVIRAAPMTAPAGMVDADGPRTEMPAGFDISRFGRHTQAAYRGPTPDNPSLSLKHRLKRASFYDQRERMAAAGTAQPMETPAQSPAMAPGRAEHADHIVSRMRPAKPNFRPVTA